MDNAVRTIGPIWSLWLLLCRVAVGGLLGFAAYHKIPDPQGFAFAINAYKILPDHLVHVSAFVLPWLEALVGIGLIVGLWGRASAVLASGMMIAFIVAIASVMVRPDVVVGECSCFGKANLICQGPPDWCNIAQNAVLLALSVFVTIKGPGMLSFDRLLAKRPHDAPTLINDAPPEGRPI